MKLFDEKKRLFGRIEPLELILFAVLIFALLLVALRPPAEEEPEPELYSATLLVKCTGLRDYMVEALKEGDILYEGTTEIGEIQKIEVEKQKVNKLQPDGSYREVERILYHDLMITVKTDRYYEDDGRYVNGNSMLCGTGHSLSNGIAQIDVVVREILPGEKIQQDLGGESHE